MCCCCCVHLHCVDIHITSCPNCHHPTRQPSLPLPPLPLLPPPPALLLLHLSASLPPPVPPSRAPRYLLQAFKLRPQRPQLESRRCPLHHPSQHSGSSVAREMAFRGVPDPFARSLLHCDCYLLHCPDSVLTQIAFFLPLPFKVSTIWRLSRRLRSACGELSLSHDEWILFVLDRAAYKEWTDGRAVGGGHSSTTTHHRTAHSPNRSLTAAASRPLLGRQFAATRAATEHWYETSARRWRKACCATVRCGASLSQLRACGVSAPQHSARHG